jgi:hypothetical protein
MRGYRKHIPFAVFLCVLTLSFSAGAGRLVDFVRSFEFPESESLEQLPYSESEISALSNAISGEHLQNNFRRELVTDDNRTFSLIYSSEVAGAPIIIIADNPDRDIILEAPHPVKDRATGIQTAHLLIALGARAAIISGNNRCAARTLSSCSGKTRICDGRRRAYPTSDPAHNTESLFHQAHIALAKRWPDAKIIQLHGYRQRDSDTLFVLSDGTRIHRRPDDGFSGKVRDRIRVATGNAAIAVSCQDPADRRFDYRPLCARTNVQGRHINGSEDQCRSDATLSSGRFLHIEQQYKVREAIVDDPQTALQSAEYGALFLALAAETRCLKSSCRY